MGSDADDVVGKIKGKARTVVEGLLGKDESRGDADPDIEYEPTPNQNVLYDGMVVLSESQSEKADADGADSGADAAAAAGTGSASVEDDAATED